MDFADANLFVVIANMIATMNISKAKDNEGQEITPPYAFTSGFVRYVMYPVQPSSN